MAPSATEIRTYVMRLHSRPACAILISRVAFLDLPRCSRSLRLSETCLRRVTLSIRSRPRLARGALQAASFRFSALISPDRYGSATKTGQAGCRDPETVAVQSGGIHRVASPGVSTVRPPLRPNLSPSLPRHLARDLEKVPLAVTLSPRSKPKASRFARIRRNLLLVERDPARCRRTVRPRAEAGRPGFRP